MAKQKIEKTNAARLLDRAKIKYELIPYLVDENDLAAGHVAEQLGEDIETVFKTLVLVGDKSGYIVCVVPGNHEVDLKLAAKVSGNKWVEMIPMKELLGVTGYIRGGCSPIGMKKTLPDIHSPELHGTRCNIYQCRRAWLADSHCAAGSDLICRCRGGGDKPRDGEIEFARVSFCSFSFKNGEDKI